MSLDWNKYMRKRIPIRRDYNVRVSLYSRNNCVDSKLLSIVFHDNCFDNILGHKAGESDYLLFAVDDDANRVYFKVSNKNDGYLLYRQNQNYDHTRLIQTVVKGNAIDYWLVRCGQYELSFDDDLGLYYIDLERKV